MALLKLAAWRVTLLPTLAMALILLITAGCGLPAIPRLHTPQALAKDGGVRLILVVGCPATDAHCNVAAQMKNEISVLTQRAQNGLGIADANVKQLDATHIEVDVPGTQHTDTQGVASVLAKTGELDFLDTGGQTLQVGEQVQQGQYPVVFSGTQIDPNSVTASIDPQTRQPVVTFAFAGSARQAFADYTRNHIGQPLTIALDNVVIESATIQRRLTGRRKSPV